MNWNAQVISCPADLSAIMRIARPMNQAKMPAAEGEAIAKNARPTVTSVLNEAENLEGDHRQDARHEVKDEAADETEEEELEQAIRRR